MWRTLPVVAALLTWLPLETARSDDAVAISTLIDHHVQARLEDEGLERGPQADDAEFLRRVFLDLHGVVPTAERAARFLDNRDSEKRARLVDELLASPRFGEHFGDVWRGYLVSSVADQQLPTASFAEWMADRFNSNQGWDRIVSDLVTATGKIDENPAVTYLIEGRNPLGVTDLTDLSSRYFLGIRLNCAQCHDHPFVEWKQRDYWGMAAFFAQIQTPGRPKMVHSVGVRDDPLITLATLKDADMLEGFQPQPPTFLGGEVLPEGVDEASRASLARWITSPENPYFARATVNRMWWHFFGSGIVHPVDDMHAGSPPSHPELLELLSRRFAESGFDLKLLCQAIMNSHTYQQTSQVGAQGDAEAELFARMPVKVLTAEQLYDSLVAILGPPGKSPGTRSPLGLRREFCQYFSGDGDPEPTHYARGIPHALRLMNSPQFTGHSLQSLVSRVTASERSPDEAVEELFLTILARRPAPAELQLVQAHLRDADESPQTAYYELAWALLMSSEFTLNH